MTETNSLISIVHPISDSTSGFSSFVFLNKYLFHIGRTPWRNGASSSTVDMKYSPFFYRPKGWCEDKTKKEVSHLSKLITQSSMRYLRALTSHEYLIRSESRYEPSSLSLTQLPYSARLKFTGSKQDFVTF